MAGYGARPAIAYTDYYKDSSSTPSDSSDGADTSTNPTDANSNNNNSVSAPVGKNMVQARKAALKRRLARKVIPQ